MNVPSYSALQDRERRIKTLRELCEIVGKLENELHPKNVSELNNDAGYINSHDNAIVELNQQVYTLKKSLGNLGGNAVFELPDYLGHSFNALMGNNGTVKLSENVSTGRFGPGILASNKVTLDINGHSLTFPNLSSSNAGIMARGTQEITIKGKGTIDSDTGMAVMCSSRDAVINLTGSTTVYTANRPGAELIYCYQGTINITNGTFRNSASPYLLNCYDANYKNGTAQIIVTGGKFYDFDPSNCISEGTPTSFVPEGYAVTSAVVVEDEEQHTVYTVKKA